MPLNKSINLKLSLNKEIFSGQKIPMIVIGMGFIVSIVLIYLVSNQYDNFERFSEAQMRHQKLISDTSSLEKNIKSLARQNSDYFNSLALAPKNKPELISALTKLIADNNLKLIKLNTNENNTADKKNNTIELSIDGTYEKIVKFTGAMNSIIISSEIINFKITKKEGLLLHLDINLKFVEPPLKNQNKQAYNDGYHNAFKIHEAEGWSLIKAGFVQANPAEPQNNQAPQVNQAIPQQIKQDESIGTNKTTLHDPFDPAGATVSKDNNTATKKENGVRSGYYLSGILYSDNAKLCLVSMPGGRTKIFAENENISKLIKIIAIESDHIIVSSKKRPKVLVGEEALP